MAQTTGEAGMAKRKGYQTARVVINVTPEQLDAVRRALNSYGPRGRNEALLKMLAEFCYNENVEWPEHVKVEPVRGEGGKFTKSS